MTTKLVAPLATRRELGGFYVLLAELFGGLYPESRSLSAGPVDRVALDQQVAERLNGLVARAADPPMKSIKEDYAKVRRLLSDYASLPEAKRSHWLEKHSGFRDCLTDKALSLMREAYGDAPVN